MDRLTTDRNDGVAPAVSVVMPFLDPPLPFFREAIESVFSQRFEDWELLLVNDGSGAEARAEAERWRARDDERVRLLEHPGARNRGVPAARNLGIAHARGGVTAFLDADDRWLPERLGEHVHLLALHPAAGMVFGPSLYWRSWHASTARDFVPPTRVPPEVVVDPTDLLLHILRGEGAVPCPTAVTCRTEALRDVGGFVEDFGVPTEDQAFFVRFLLRHPGLATDRVLDRYRQHPASATGAASEEDEARWRRILLEWSLDQVRAGAPGATRVRTAIQHELRLLDRPREARLRRIAGRLRHRLRGRRPARLRPLDGHDA